MLLQYRHKIPAKHFLGSSITKGLLRGEEMGGGGEGAQTPKCFLYEVD